MAPRPTAPPLPTSQEEFLGYLTVTKQAEKGIIKDPPNSILLFRKWFIDYIFPLILWMQGCKNPADAMKGLEQKVLSRWAAAVWKSLPKERKDFWTLVAQGVRVHHARRYPSHHTAEAKARRAAEKQQKARTRQRSARTAVRSSPYPSQPTRGLPTSSIHLSTPQLICGPSTPIDGYTTSLPTYYPVIQPTMYVGPPTQSMAATSSFPVPPSFRPPMTLPLSAPLPSSSLIPPQSWLLPQRHTLPFSPTALPFPILSSTPTATLPASPAAFPPQSRYQAPPGGYFSIPSVPNPQGSENATHFPFELREAPQGALQPAMHPLPIDDRTARFPTTFFGINPFDPLLRL